MRYFGPVSHRGTDNFVSEMEEDKKLDARHVIEEAMSRWFVVCIFGWKLTSF